MKSTIVYEKHFTGLEGLQEEQQVQYIMLAHPTKHGIIYGIQVIEETKEQVLSQKVEDVSYSESHIKALITFLYENAVPASSCKEIIQELA